MRAFTLVELLTVLAILALVLGGGLTVFGFARQGTLRQQTRAQLATLAVQIDGERLRAGSYPALVNAQDAWGNDLSYVVIGGGFTLTSPGEDTVHSSDDIVYDSTKD